MYTAEQVPHKGLLLAKSIEVQTGKEADVRSTLLCVYFCSFVRVCALVCAGDALYAWCGSCAGCLYNMFTCTDVVCLSECMRVNT